MRWAGYFLILAILLWFHWFLPNTVVFAVVLALILIPILSAGLMWTVRGRVRLELSAPATGQKGKKVSVCAKLQKQTLCPVGRLEMTVSVVNSITGESQRRKMVYVPNLSWDVNSDHCGCLYIRVEKVRLYDLFGLLWVSVPAPKEKRVVIMPDTFQMLIQQDVFPAPAEDCRDYAPNRKGQDRTETYQIRNYVPGDSLAQIHWKLSSKLDSLMVRDPGLPMDQNLMVFLDRSWGSITPAQADAIMEAAVSVCQSLCEASVPFQLVWNEETVQIEYVTDQDMLPAAVSELLKSKDPGNGLPGTDVYLGLYGAARVSRIIYIGTGIPDSLEEFGGQSRVVSLLCARGGEDDGVLTFTPENYEEVLAQVSWS